MNREEFEAAIFKMIDYAKKMSDIGDEIARKCNWDQDMCSLLRKIEAGDVLIGLSSTGCHSNGYSLVRKLVKDFNEPFAGKTIGEVLLTPTRIYVRPVMDVLSTFGESVHGMVHITGGGFYENIPRALPKTLAAKIERNAVQVLPIFDLIARSGSIPERDMFNTFNMGVGMVVSVDKNDADKAVAAIKAAGEDAYILGELVESDEGVIIC